MSEVRSVWVTTRLPQGDDPGAGEIGYYRVVDGLLQMCDETGKPTGRKVKLDGEDPARIATRLTHQAWMKRARKNNFDRPLVYPKIGLA